MIQRYKMKQEYMGYRGYMGSMAKHDNGDYVLYEDYAALEVENRMLQAKVLSRDALINHYDKENKRLLEAK